MIAKFPVVWMLRIIQRAERVGAAMEVRGYDAAAACISDNRPLKASDLAAMGCLLSLLAVAALYRLGVL
ncbi:MAG: hypothetical protein V1913_16030 [Fibrobacterota bacterium]